MTNTDWITEGAIVAEYEIRNGADRVSFTRVERLTATQAVCASGNRYRRDNGRIVGGDWRCELREADDPSVRNTAARRAVESLRYPLDRLLAELRGGEPDMLAILDRIEQMVAEARATIADPTHNR